MKNRIGERLIPHIYRAGFVLALLIISVSLSQGQSPRSARSSAPATQGRCDPAKQEQTDLSGTYTGNFKTSNESNFRKGTLIVTGNNFTLTSESETVSGRIVAVTTCGYTAVTLMQGDFTPADPAHPAAFVPAMSFRAKKKGDKITLKAVPGENKNWVFQCDCPCGRPCDCCP
jgi:hypothetical protein